MIKDTYLHLARRDQFNLAVVGTFLAALLLAGGASRPNEFGQPIIRIISVMVLVWAWAQAPMARVRPSGPVVLFGLFTVWIAVQLVPLPPGLWAQLPGRALYLDALAAAGVPPVWRPISLTPDLTLNTLLGLLPTGAMLAILARLPRSAMPVLLPLVLATIGASMLLGLLQAAAGSPYFYRVTNTGSAVGSFANRNHFALLVSCLLPLLAAGISQPIKGGEAAGAARDWTALCAALIVFPVLLITGSRGGLLTGALGAAGGLAIIICGRADLVGRRRLLWPLVAFVGAAIVAAVFVFFARAEAIDRLLASDGEDLRSSFVPLVLRMIGDYFPFGSGFGSFASVYRIVEPTSVLDTSYANQAHNDWLQVVLEGGAPGLAILVAAVAWAVRRSWRAWRTSRASRETALARAASIVVGLVAVSSAFDYPLRTPMFGALLAVLALWMGSRPESPPAHSQP